MSAGTVQGKRILALRLAVILAISVGSLTVMAEPAAAQAPLLDSLGRRRRPS